MKINLIIDGHYIFHKCVFTMSKLKMIKDLKYSMTQNVKKIAGEWKYDNIYFVSDFPRSWRKDVNPSYKAQRKKSDDIDWTLAYKIYDEFKEDVKNHPSWQFFEAPGVEGDDWIASILKYTNQQGTGNVILSADKDLHQLLGWGTNPLFLNFQYKDPHGKEILYVPKGYKVIMDIMEKEEQDLFNLTSTKESHSTLLSLLRKYNIEEIDPEEALFIKILSGDAGDNIPSVWKSIPKKTGARPMGLGDAGSKKIYDAYKQKWPETIDFNKEEWRVRVWKLIVDMKGPGQVDIPELLKSNVEMIVLHGKYWPQYIKENIYEGMKNKV